MTTIPAGWKRVADIATEPEGELLELGRAIPGGGYETRTAWIAGDVVEWGAHVDGLGYIVTAEGVRVWPKG